MPHPHLVPIAQRQYEHTLNEDQLHLEVLTSSWSTGEPGPIAYCVSEGMLKAEAIQEYNLKNHGKSMIVSSGSNTHFMDGMVFINILEQLYSPAFAIQRSRLDMARQSCCCDCDSDSMFVSTCIRFKS